MNLPQFRPAPHDAAPFATSARLLQRTLAIMPDGLGARTRGGQRESLLSDGCDVDARRPAFLSTVYRPQDADHTVGATRSVPATR